MLTLSNETIGIVEATAPDVQAHAAAITFRMWHHLPSEAARRLLFAEFALDGRVMGLLDAIAVATRRRSLEGLRLLTPTEAHGSASLYSTMEPVLLLALTEALGKMASNTVLDAWRHAFRFLTEGLTV